MREKTKKLVLGISFGIIAILVAMHLGIRPSNIFQEYRDYKNGYSKQSEYVLRSDELPIVRYIHDVNYGLPQDSDDDGIPVYHGDAYVELNGNKPFFTEDELNIKTPFQSYSELDDLGRCRTNMTLVTSNTIPDDSCDRPDISNIKPTGWHTYNTQNNWGILLPDNSFYLYNRSHLLAFCLDAGNDDYNKCNSEQNLITGTRQLNLTMLEFEDKVYDYCNKKSGNSVLYRVTPVFKGDELLARGVIVEGIDRQKNGKKLQFCVFVFNVQEGFNLNYSTGEAEYVG